ncbi:MAG: hypothetical protein JKY03_07530 [Aureispira sp.]|nr:hypothetical protein [Aureispira sp.]
MNKLVGIKNLNSVKDVHSLKRDLLIFDKLVIVGLKEWLEVFEEELFSNTSELLKEKGLLTLENFIIYQGYLWMKEGVKKEGGISSVYSKTKSESSDFLNQNLGYLIEQKKIILDYSDIRGSDSYSKNKNIYEKITPILQGKINTQKKDLQSMFELCNLCYDLKIRLLANSCNNEEYTAISSASSFYPIKGITNKKSKVYNLILDDFPIIDTSILSWEQIFAFKSDPDVYNSIWGLRSWITGLSKAEKTEAEIEEEYRYLKYKYEQAIKNHKLKTEASIFQTMIQGTAELFENIAKLRLGKAASLFFRFKEEKVALMDLELNSEGNQLSYLFKMKNNFK